MIYLTLKVNGCIPIYEPKLRPPSELEELLLGKSGNCSDYSIRLLMILDVFGIPAHAVTFFTPSLPGHVVVDALDSEERIAYLLDAIMNVLAWIKDVKAGFFESLFEMDEGKRKEFFFDGNDNLLFMPWLTRYVNPGVFLEKPNPMTVQSFNRDHYLPRIEKYQKTLSMEAPQILERWRKTYPLGIQLALADFGLQGIVEFGPVHSLSTAPLLRKAGIGGG